MSQSDDRTPTGFAQPVKHFGLKERLTFSFSILFIAILVVLLLAGFTGIPFTKYDGRLGEYRAQAFRTLELVADMKKEWLLTWIEERRFDADLAGESEFVQRCVEQLRLNAPKEIGPGENGLQGYQTLKAHPAYVPLAKYLHHFGGLHTMYKRIKIADARTGRVIISTRESDLGGDLSHFPSFLGALASRHDYVGTIRPEDQSGSPVLGVSHVIRDGQGGIMAVVILTVDVDNILKPVLHTGRGMGDTGEVLLFNEDRLVLMPLKFPLADGSSAKAFQYRSPGTPAMLAASGLEGVVEALDYRDEMVFAAHRYIKIFPEWGWGMVVKVDRSEILAPMRLDMRNSIILGLTGLFAIVVLTMVAAARIVRPIYQLTQTASRLASGDRSVRCGLNRPDEIGVLASTFDSMADRIDAAWTDLEDRTERLRISKEAVQLRQRILESTMAVSNVLASAPNLDELLKSALNQLMKGSNCHVGAIYLRDETGPDQLRLRAAAGVDGNGSLPPVAAIGEGSIGLAARRRETLLLEDLPDQKRYVFSTISGELLPSFIINAPLIHREDVVGVLALAGLYPRAPEHMEIVEMSRNQLAIAIANAMAHARTGRLAEELRLSNEELQAANEELILQSDELRAQTDELREQSSELERKRLQVEEADRLKSEFLSNMSHELRTPLNSILALSQLMMHRGTGKDPAEEAEFLQVIERNGERLLNLINDLLDLAKIESGRMDLAPDTVDPRRVVEKAVETVKPLSDRKNLELTVAVADVPMLHTDEGRLSQILLNLLSNAVKFTDSGTVAVDVSSSADVVRFTVSDTGIGIVTEHQARIFDEFRQVDGSNTRRYQGTGLGLTIAMKLARMLGGDISVESELGRGSSFCLTLPISHDSTAGARAGSRNARIDLDAPPSRQGDARGYDQTARRTQPDHPLILVVEDNEVASLQIRSVLEKNGYAVRRASGGNEAVYHARESVPDAIILDLMMPDMDGFQVLEEIRRIPSASQVPVLILTAKDITAQDLKRLRHNSIYQLVQKGTVNKDQLLEIIGRIFEEHPQPPDPPAAGAVDDPERKEAEPAILVVEDNPDNLLAITAILKDMGLARAIAGNGMEAVDMAKKLRPRLILMDVQLPGMSGLEATNIIKADPALKNTPIIALTARAMKGDREEILLAGFDDYLSKPLSPRGLVSMVRKWTQGRC